uniref:Uncharacterized protein n=1 Tax=Eucampia antarctica TaxID=49252 RepID=A0A6U0RQY0_9STRA|mmetsp:Transcript_23399/g.22460  ORF Transcript_23399/g.22460 Transcript_23399/m.22460 type:complete len:100 (+) Transcript_23399:295-594(+)
MYTRLSCGPFSNLENDSDLNSRSRDSIDDRFDVMLNDEELVSFIISNESVTDSPCAVIADNRRIAYDSCIGPLSEASTNCLYDFIEESIITVYLLYVVI